MKTILDKTIQIVTSLLPFLRRGHPKELQDFTDLLTGQFSFLTEQLEKALQEYCLLSEKIREMHREIRQLNSKLNEALKTQCLAKDCDARI